MCDAEMKAEQACGRGEFGMMEKWNAGMMKWWKCGRSARRYCGNYAVIWLRTACRISTT
jgi:hypothetical protein